MENLTNRFPKSFKGRRSYNYVSNDHIISHEIESWKSINPFYKKYFENTSVRDLLNLCLIITHDHLSRKQLITHFIGGLALYPIYLESKSEEHGKIFDALTKPVIELIKDQIISTNYSLSLDAETQKQEYSTNNNSISPPITFEELERHIARIKAFPLTPHKYYEIKKNWMDWLADQQSLYKKSPKAASEGDKIVSNPKFHPEYVKTVYDFLYEYFEIEQQPHFLNILKSGEDVKRKLVFLSNGNRLADSFKQLHKANIIIDCQKSDLERWIIRNFCYKYRNNVKEFTQNYINMMISTKKDLCQNPIIDVKLDKQTGKYFITKI